MCVSFISYLFRAVYRRLTPEENRACIHFVIRKEVK
jgi:hypothetical protein